MNWNQRLTQARVEKNLSKSELARAINVSPATITQWESGTTKELKGENLTLVCAVLDVTAEWLLHGKGQRATDPLALLPGSKRVEAHDDDSPVFYQIPKVRLKLQAGVMGVLTEPLPEEGGKATILRSWVDRRGFHPEKLVAIEVRGESMEPTLYAGDTVFINLADTQPVENGVFAVNYEGEAVVKRLSRDAGDWWLTSDNSDQRKYHRKVCRGVDCLIVGRIVYKESEHI
jgi:phage repressor protein C with HTH and peptisase S24 domain